MVTENMRVVSTVANPSGREAKMLPGHWFARRSRTIRWVLRKN
jgi:hypothetical protein